MENYSELVSKGKDYYYYKFKFKEVPSGLKFEYGEAIPWFDELGGATQVKSSNSFQNLSNEIEVIEKWKMNNGVWTRIDDAYSLVRNEFNAYGTEWQKINPHNGKEMFNSESLGYVVSHSQHNVIIGNVDSISEFAIAEALANDGYKVKLLSESAPAGIKTPDAEIIGKGIFDFKNVNSTSTNGINTNIRDYMMSPSKRSNAEGLVFNIKNNPSASPASVNQGVLDAISTANSNGTLSNLASQIGVVYSDGTIKLISLTEFRNGTRF